MPGIAWLLSNTRLVTSSPVSSPPKPSCGSVPHFLKNDYSTFFSFHSTLKHNVLKCFYLSSIRLKSIRVCEEIFFLSQTEIIWWGRERHTYYETAFSPRSPSVLPWELLIGCFVSKGSYEVSGLFSGSCLNFTLC